jgi:hypothetical protein
VTGLATAVPALPRNGSSHQLHSVHSKSSAETDAKIVAGCFVCAHRAQQNTMFLKCHHSHQPADTKPDSSLMDCPPFTGLAADAMARRSNKTPLPVSRCAIEVTGCFPGCRQPPALDAIFV